MTDPDPLVRPYFMTGGRTRPLFGLDLLAFVLAVETAPRSNTGLQPEHLAALEACRHPVSVAEVASQLDLPVGVTRVLLSDLMEADLVMVRQPADRPQLADPDLLHKLLKGLEAL